MNRALILPPVAFALAAVLCLASRPSNAAAQAAGAAGHEHHKMMMAEAAPVPSAARPMERQPAVDGIALVDMQGRTVMLDEALEADVPVMVNFIFTTCTTICPVMSAGFAQLQKRVAAEGGRVRLVSISIDPEVDTPARLREYAARRGAGPDWVFLTGPPAASEAAQRAFGAFRGSKEAHTADTYVRRNSTAPWERIEGLASGEALLRAFNNAASGGQR